MADIAFTGRQAAPTAIMAASVCYSPFPTVQQALAFRRACRILSASTHLCSRLRADTHQPQTRFGKPFLHKAACGTNARTVLHKRWHNSPPLAPTPDTGENTQHIQICSSKAPSSVQHPAAVSTHHLSTDNKKDRSQPQPQQPCAWTVLTTKQHPSTVLHSLTVPDCKFHWLVLIRRQLVWQ